VKREFLSALESLGPNRPDLLAAEMVYGELISNVVRHTPGSARMQLGVDDGKVVLQVDDKGPLFTTSENGARAKLPNGDLECGRGLYIIETLCERIEVEPIDGGKRTTVALPPATEPGDGHSSPSK
jgi:anti-sigma regulatory factor (Ser/Thr protein kinase)